MIYLVILVQNDQETLPPFLAAVQVASTEWDEAHQALVVDDGSTDESADVVRDFGKFELLRQPGPAGEGAALRTGLETVLERADPTDIIATLDARIIHSPALIKPMLPLIRQEHDVVLASRYMKGGAEVGLSAAQVLVNRASSYLMKWLLSTAAVEDFTGRCRAHRAGILLEAAARYQDTLIQESDSACWLELLLKLARLGETRFGQVPQAVRYDLQPEFHQESIWATVRQQASILSRGWRYR